MDQSNAFFERCLSFSVGILDVSSCLPRSRSGRHIADQLLRSGTSVGANVQEARSGESRADFIHKMQVALKEVRETLYWLALIQKATLVKKDSLPSLVKECNEITAIIAKSVITAKKNDR